MNREIRFRGLRTDGGGWVEGDLIQPNNIFNTLSGMVKVHPETVGQFTGLKDKKGKEIYLDDTYLDDDGDLFKVVELDCGKYALHLIGSNYIDEFVLWKQIEIIGNIHEKTETK